MRSMTAIVYNIRKALTNNGSFEPHQYERLT